MARLRCITYSMASVDGRVTIAPGVSLLAGDARWEAITAGVSVEPYRWVRRTHEPQALLEGSGSFLPGGDLADPDGVAVQPATDLGGAGGPTSSPLPHDPAAPTTPPGHHLPADVVRVPGRRWFAVVDGRGRVDLQLAEWPDDEWAGWHALVLTSRAAPADHLAILRERAIPYLVCGQERVDLPLALELLGSLLGVRTLVCTGGGRLGGAMLRAGLVDEIDVDVLPAAIGGRGTPALFDAPPLGADEWPTPLELISAEALPGGLVRMRYLVRR